MPCEASAIDRAGLAHASYWNSFARAFATLGPPLRPSSEDIRLMEATVADWAAARLESPFHALLLGVTPQIATMRWPEESTLLAVDNSMPMTRTVWPGDVTGQRRAVCGNWLALPLRASSCGLAIGDGSLNCMRYPEGFRTLGTTIADVLGPEGILVLRCYIQPCRRERPEEVFADLFRSTIPSFHHFKFRLLMALQQSAEEGIAVNEVHRYWVSREVDKDLLVSRTGWPMEAIDTIEFYRGSGTIHTFPTLPELRAVLLDCLDEVSLAFPPYPLGERCPILVLRPARR